MEHQSCTRWLETPRYRESFFRRTLGVTMRTTSLLRSLLLVIIALFVAVGARAEASETLPAPVLKAEDSSDPNPPSSEEPPPVSGSFPTASDPLGHKHPSCLSEFGKTAAQIEATSCGFPSQDIPGGTTISACTHRGVMDFEGDNITVSCVNWVNDSDTAAFSTRCKDFGDHACSNIVIDRVTLVGNDEAPMKCLEVTNRGGPSIRAMKIEKSDISGCETNVYMTACNGDTHPLPGEGSFACVLRGNRIHGNGQPPGGHVGVVGAHGTSGILIENNRLDGSNAKPGANVGQTLAASNTSNLVIRNNHLLSDDNGHMFRYDTNAPGADCADPTRFDNNVVTWTSDTLFAYGRAEFDKACPSIVERSSPSSCDGNTTFGTPGFPDGASIRCTGAGR